MRSANHCLVRGSPADPHAAPFFRRDRIGLPRGGFCLPILVALALAGQGIAAAGDDQRAVALQNAASLRAAGRLDEALDLLRIESREVKRLEGDDSPQLLLINDLAAEILIDMGRLANAQSLVEKTIAAREQAVARGRAEQADKIAGSLLTLARLHLAAKRFSDAVAAATRSLASADRTAGPGSESVQQAEAALAGTTDALEELLGPSAAATIRARRDAAAALASFGLLAAAINQRERIYAGLRADESGDPAAILTAAEQLGTLLRVAGFPERAMAILAEQMPPGRRPESAAEIDVLRALGRAQLAADQLILAESTYDRLLEVTASRERAATVRSAADRLRRLLVAIRREEIDELPDWWDETLTMLRKTPPTAASDGLAGLLAAGDVLAALGDRAAAVEPASRAVALAKSPRSPSDAEIAAAEGQLVAALLAAGDAAAARKACEPALDAAEKALGPGDPRTSTLRLLLVAATAESGDRQRALALAEAALTRGLPRPDAAWEETAVAIYDRLAAGANDASLRTAFAAARERQFGREHPHVGMAWALFGEARLAAGDWPAARNCFQRAGAVQEQALGKDHPETAASLTLLAHAQRAAGEPTKAERTATAAVAAWERVGGPDHPGTLAALDVLVASRLQAGETAGVAELLERLCRAEAFGDPVMRAAHLVRLADLLAGHDQAAASGTLERAWELPCWNIEQPTPAERLRLAYTAARAAHASFTMQDQPAGEAALRKARSLALQAADPAAVLAALERLAKTGQATRTDGAD